MKAYFSADGFEKDLQRELRGVTKTYGRLVFAEDAKGQPAWAQNVWLKPETVPIRSVKDAASILKGMQRHWVPYVHHWGQLHEELNQILPPAELEPIDFLDPLPKINLGSYTLLKPDTLVYSRQCSSAFPNGEVQFNEDRKSPPSRAYLKLWELFTVHGVLPKTGESCLDLGSSPGGWTWVLAKLGCKVVSVDKAPLAPLVAKMKGVKYLQASAFALEPNNSAPVDWIFSDVVCYPARLLSLVERWRESGRCRNFVCTLKFQGETDHATAKKFASIPGSRLIHLSCNRHELTWICIDPRRKS